MRTQRERVLSGVEEAFLVDVTLALNLLPPASSPKLHLQMGTKPAAHLRPPGSAYDSYLLNIKKKGNATKELPCKGREPGVCVTLWIVDETVFWRIGTNSSTGGNALGART